jgi:hypothetical protein
MIAFPLALMLGGFIYDEEIARGKELLRQIAYYLDMGERLRKLGGTIRK